MSNVGSVRRVDSLGRIVIPKDIRTTLRIKPNDCLEIHIEDDNILLKKKDFLSDYPSSFENILKIYKKLLDVDILITDTDKFIYILSDKLNDYIFKELDSKLYEIIIKAKPYIINNCDFLDLKNVSFLLQPLLINGDVLGSVILIKDNSNINDVDKFCIDTLNNLIINYLEV